MVNKDPSCCTTIKLEIVVPLLCYHSSVDSWQPIMGGDLKFFPGSRANKTETATKMRLWNEAAKLMHVQSFDFH